jgi:hypothetical protein
MTNLLAKRVSQVMPAEILDSGLLNVLLPVGMLNPIVKRLAVPTEKHERIMEHPRKALQGFDEDLIHRDISGSPSIWIH